ncbi:MAG: hypothetical protein IJW70_00035 [Clostridia bacterium]|nr:hypothetical protein [Clostridia bacterium]
MKIKTFFSILLCSLMLLVPLTAFAETPPPEGQGLIITEICYNPAWKEGDEQIEDNADVFPYTEIYNSTDKDISLADISLTYRSQTAGALESGKLICAGDTPVLGAGEIAVIVHYNKNWATLGIDNTAEDASKIYQAFVDLHGIADILDKNHFFITPNKDFKLDKESENASMELFHNGTLVWSVTYNSLYYNRNNRAVVLSTDGSCMGSAMPKPGEIYDNQIPSNPALVPDTLTIPIKAIEYNICASGIPNDYEDIPFIADRYDEALALIKAEDPDLIMFCEVNFAWQEYLQAFFAENGYTAYGFSSNGKDFNGKMNKSKWDLISLIVWKTDRFEVLDQGRFWCSNKPDKKGTFNWDGGVTGDFARCINHATLKDKESGVEFFFLGAHIDAKVDEARTLSAQLIYDRAHQTAGERPIIMLGDWNANQTRESYKILTSGDLADARFRTTQTDLHGTFNKWGEYSADIQTRLPIDHCFITKDKIWVDYYKQILGDPIENVPGPSDHNMTVFSLQISTGEPIPETTEPETTEPDTTEPGQSTQDNTAQSTGCKSTVGTTVALVTLCSALIAVKKKSRF